MTGDNVLPPAPYQALASSARRLGGYRAPSTGSSSWWKAGHSEWGCAPEEGAGAAINPYPQDEPGQGKWPKLVAADEVGVVGATSLSSGATSRSVGALMEPSR
jgi:hypothetical protein